MLQALRGLANLLNNECEDGDLHSSFYILGSCKVCGVVEQNVENNILNIIKKSHANYVLCITALNKVGYCLPIP